MPKKETQLYATYYIRLGLLTLAFVHILARRTAPRRIIVQRQTAFAVRTVRVMLAVANACPLAVQAATHHTFTGVTVALATRTDRNISNRIKVRLQHGRIAKDLIAERIQTLQHDPNIGSRHPVLQFGAMIEIDGTRSALQ